MPQFDVYSFMSQLFWVFLLFFIFYVIILRWVLPAIAVTLKTRKKLISNDSDSEISVSSRSIFRVKGEPLLVASSAKCLQLFQDQSVESGAGRSDREYFKRLMTDADHLFLSRYHANVSRSIKAGAVSNFLDYTFVFGKKS